MRVLLIFLDGVGIGSNDPDANPFLRARLDTLGELLGDITPLTQTAPHKGPNAILTPLDATLGVPGLPQSGTGQTALFTGMNAPAQFGRHFGPWVPVALREPLRQQNLLTLAGAAGRKVAFANAYPEELFADDQADRRTRDRTRGPVVDPLRAGPPIVALGAGVLNRHTTHLMRGDAVASEITNDGWRKHLHRTDLPVIRPAEAGRNLSRIAAQHDLTLFAHYSTDYVGHRGHMWEAVEALQKVDEFLSGVIAGMENDLTVIVASDHGNIEDIRIGHTLNPAFGLVFGADYERIGAGLTSLVDVAPRILSTLEISTP